MSNWEHFPNAPIVEAIIDIRIEPSSDARWMHKASDFPVLQSSYPTVENQLAVLFQAQVFREGTPQPEIASDITGIRFRGDHEAIQLRIDGFTFSMLGPYSSWDELLTKAWNAWEIYKPVVPNATIVRLAVRYINRIQLPLDKALNTFLTAPPRLPESLRFPLRRFFTNYGVEQNSETHATIIQTVEPESSGTLPFILDIDAFRTGSFAVEDDRIRETFESLHDFKNEIFFNLITEEAKQLWR
jgi:uncharacterized protein (TIGR04255 family)